MKIARLLALGCQRVGTRILHLLMLLGLNLRLVCLSKILGQAHQGLTVEYLLLLQHLHLQRLELRRAFL